MSKKKKFVSKKKKFVSKKKKFVSKKRNLCQKKRNLCQKNNFAKNKFFQKKQKKETSAKIVLPENEIFPKKHEILVKNR